MNYLAVVELLDPKHNFLPVSFRGITWDLSHLDSFVFRLDPGVGLKIDVVVIFSCHCFTRSVPKDSLLRSQIPNDEIYSDGKEERVLDTQRYELSKLLLRPLVTGLPERRIIIANHEQGNFMTVHVHDSNGANSIYGVFFDTEKDRERKGRIFLRIQSAYILDNGLTKRQKTAKRVKWLTLLKATYEGRKIKP
jgi:hypothetical protein